MKWIALLSTMFLTACINKCVIESPQVNVSQQNILAPNPKGSIDVTTTSIKFY